MHHLFTVHEVIAEGKNKLRCFIFLADFITLLVFGVKRLVS